MKPLWRRLVWLPRDGLILLVRGYRLLLKPWLGHACSFEPTCSQYALDALGRHGALAGGALAAGRILRCHPWCAGGCDAVPGQAPRLFRALGLGAVEPAPMHPSAEGQRAQRTIAPCAEPAAPATDRHPQAEGPSPRGPEA